MIDPKQIDTLAKNLFSALPQGLQNIEQEIENQFKDVLQSAFEKLDLVTRDAFDVQTKVLERTREKLDALEVQVNELSNKQ